MLNMKRLIWSETSWLVVFIFKSGLLIDHLKWQFLTREKSKSQGHFRPAFGTLMLNCYPIVSLFITGALAGWIIFSLRRQDLGYTMEQ
jgi:hypothetical protein